MTPSAGPGDDRSSTGRSRPRPGGPPLSHPIVVFLAREGCAERLLAEHVDDGTGHCAVCPAAGQAGRVTWPCSLANYATAAQHLADGRPAT